MGNNRLRRNVRAEFDSGVHAREASRRDRRGGMFGGGAGAWVHDNFDRISHSQSRGVFGADAGTQRGDRSGQFVRFGHLHADLYPGCHDYASAATGYLCRGCRRGARAGNSDMGASAAEAAGDVGILGSGDVGVLI